MNKMLINEKQPFEIQVPYQLTEEGEGSRKPLIIYLHGYKQNINLFKKKMADLLAMEAYHLFIQGPYPIYDEQHKRNVENWGRAWYLYDGGQQQFIASLEETAAFIQEIYTTIVTRIDNNRTALVGYSMGGYQAGYFGLSRPALIDELVVIGGRIKTEHFDGRQYPDLNVLSLHGRRDTSVAESRARESCEMLRKMGASVSFCSLDEPHKLTARYVSSAQKWLKQQGYKQAAGLG